MQNNGDTEVIQSQNPIKIKLYDHMYGSCKFCTILYTVFQKKTPTHIVGYKLRNSCLILIIFDTEIPDII